MVRASIMRVKATILDLDQRGADSRAPAP